MTDPQTPPPPGWPARWGCTTPTIHRPLSDKRKTHLKRESMRYDTKETRQRWLLLVHTPGRGTFPPRWSPGSPSPPYRTFLWRTAQRSARVGICLLSTPLPSIPLPERSLLVFPSAAVAEEVFPYLGRSASAVAPPALVVASVSKSYQVRARTSVSRIWLPVTSPYISGWVSCSQLCLSVCSHNVCCIRQPPSERWPTPLFLRFILS